MRLYVKITVVFTLILLIMHYRKYNNFSDGYEIQQQELDYTEGNELYNQLNPLIITFIENTSLKNNVESYKLHSILSFNKNFKLYNTNNDYLSHHGEILLIRSKHQQQIELVNPKYNNNFKHKKTGDTIFNHSVLPKKNNENVKAIDIVLREYNILFIPRHWLFKFGSTNKSVEVFTTHNIFTKIFSILH